MKNFKGVTEVTEQMDFIQGHFQHLRRMKELHLQKFHSDIKRMRELKKKHLDYLKQGFYRHQDFIALVCSIFLSLFSLIMLGKIYLV